MAQPLHDLVKKNQPNKVKWEEKHQQAFDKIKEALCCQPILALPDLNLPFLLRTDASNDGIGATLYQEFLEGERPVAYWGRKFKPAERNYAVVEKELLAIVEAVKKFHPYLYGQPFELETDHMPLTYMKGSASKNARLTRWSLFLQDYNFAITHIRGKDNVCADYISRSN